MAIAHIKKLCFVTISQETYFFDGFNIFIFFSQTLNICTVHRDKGKWSWNICLLAVLETEAVAVAVGCKSQY